MGEAKANRERLREQLLAEVDRWLFPPTYEERALVAELMGMEPTTVRRESAERLAWAKMKPQQCHANTRWYAANDPERITRQVLGWWRQGDNFVLHSVIGSGNDMICITPQRPEVPDLFPFIPDLKIEARPEGDFMEYYRDGWRLPIAVRGDPEASIAINNRMAERLRGGMKPWDAVDMAEREQAGRLGLS